MKNDSPFFTLSRFEPDTWLIYGLLIFMTVVLYEIGFSFLAIMPLTVIAIIFIVEAMEVLHLDYPRKKQPVGARCKVIRQISRAERGVVRILYADGMTDWELWSAESNCLLEEGSDARVTGIRSIILQVEPLN